MRRLGILLAFVALFFSLPAQAARLSFVGVANSSQPTQPGTEFTPATAYGGGALLEFRLLPMIGLELGGLYAPRKASYSTVTPVISKVTVTTKVYEFPALLKLHLGHFFAFGVGGYYAKGKGDATVETDIGGAKTTQNETFAQLQQSDSDYGIATSLALTTRLAPLTYFLLDGRYLIVRKLGTPQNPELAAGAVSFFAACL